MGSKQACRTVIEQARDAWVARDANASHSCLHDGELIVPGQRWQGRAKFEEVTDPFRSAVFRWNDIRRIIIEDNQAAVEHYEDTERLQPQQSRRCHY